MMIFIYAFLVGGLICAIAQLIQELFKLTPGHMTSLFVMLGVFLDFFNFYDWLAKVSGAGALLPITSFGHSLAHASYERSQVEGVIGVFTGMFDKTSSGIVLTIILSVVIGLVFRPKE